MLDSVLLYTTLIRTLLIRLVQPERFLHLVFEARLISNGQPSLMLL